MPQMQMPFFPQGMTHINPMLAFSKEGGKIAYVTGNLQIYSHEEDDSVAFKMITAQFCANGMAKQQCRCTCKKVLVSQGIRARWKYFLRKRARQTEIDQR